MNDHKGKHESCDECAELYARLENLIDDGKHHVFVIEYDAHHIVGLAAVNK